MVFSICIASIAKLVLATSKVYKHLSSIMYSYSYQSPGLVGKPGISPLQTFPSWTSSKNKRVFLRFRRSTSNSVHEPYFMHSSGSIFFALEAHLIIFFHERVRTLQRGGLIWKYCMERGLNREGDFLERGFNRAFTVYTSLCAKNCSSREKVSVCCIQAKMGGF